MSGEPKTLTPGLEARLTVTQVNALVIAIKECWEFAHGHGFGPHREGKAAMEALRAAFPFSFGVPVVAREEASDNEGVDLERCACCGQQFDANHLDHDTLTCQNCIGVAVDLYHSQGEAAELREENKRLSALVDELLLAPNPLDDENMRLRTEVAELREALLRCSNLIQDFLDFGVAPSDRGPARHAVDAARAVLAATEGKS